jgi:hypothetical protein
MRSKPVAISRVRIFPAIISNRCLLTALLGTLSTRPLCKFCDNLQATLNGKALLFFIFTWRLLSCFAAAALLGWMVAVRKCGEQRKECTEDMMAGV